MKLQRVCLINPQGFVLASPPLGKTDTGGQTLYVLDLAKALGKRGVAVDIITRKFGNYKEEETIAPRVRIVRIKSNGKEFVNKEEMYKFMPEFSQNFLEYVHQKKIQYDLVHSHYWDGGLGGLIISKALSIPHVFTSHSLGKVKEMRMEKSSISKFFGRLKGLYSFGIRTEMEQRIIDETDAILALSQLAKSNLIHYYHADPKKITIINPGIDTDFFHPRSGIGSPKVQLKKNSLLTVNRMVLAKGLDILAEALSYVSSDFHWYLAGGNEKRSEQTDEERIIKRKLTTQFKNYNMKGKVTFLGSLSHDELLPLYFRHVNIFVLPSRYEPFGLATLEAMASGTVPIVTDICGSKEVIADGVNGFVVKAGDRKELGKKIQLLLEDEKLRTEMSKNAAESVKKDFSWDVVGDKIISFYESLL